jgi:hypothetical protein
VQGVFTGPSASGNNNGHFIAKKDINSINSDITFYFLLSDGAFEQNHTRDQENSLNLHGIGGDGSYVEYTFHGTDHPKAYMEIVSTTPSVQVRRELKINQDDTVIKNFSKTFLIKNSLSLATQRNSSPPYCSNPSIVN